MANLSRLIDIDNEVGIEASLFVMLTKLYLIFVSLLRREKESGCICKYCVFVNIFLFIVVTSIFNLLQHNSVFVLCE